MSYITIKCDKQIEDIRNECENDESVKKMKMVIETEQEKLTLLKDLYKTMINDQEKKIEELENELALKRKPFNNKINMLKMKKKLYQ